MTSAGFKTFALKAVQAAGTTIALAGTIHLFLAFAVAIARKNFTYVNPVDLMGFSYVWPQYRDSLTVTIISWLIIVTIFLSILFIGINKHLDWAIINESEVGKQINRILRPSKK